MLNNNSVNEGKYYKKIKNLLRNEITEKIAKDIHITTKEFHKTIDENIKFINDEDFLRIYLFEEYQNLNGDYRYLLNPNYKRDLSIFKKILHKI